MAATRCRSAGFTLIEVLVALLIMAVLAGLAWRGLDVIVRSRDGSQAAVDRTTLLTTVLSQWELDLRALHDDPTAPALAFDGQTLRLTRRSPEGVQLVAWALHGKRWQRWVSPPVVTVTALQEAWLRSQQLQGSEPEQLVLLDDVNQWQVYFYRGNAWTNAQSTGDLTPATAAAPDAAGSAPAVQRETLPNGVRLQIDIGGRSLTRDIALAPQGP
jgi:general secretion pathway protein J